MGALIGLFLIGMRAPLNSTQRKLGQNFSAPGDYAEWFLISLGLASVHKYLRFCLASIKTRAGTPAPHCKTGVLARSSFTAAPLALQADCRSRNLDGAPLEWLALQLANHPHQADQS